MYLHTMYFLLHSIKYIFIYIYLLHIVYINILHIYICKRWPVYLTIHLNPEISKHSFQFSTLQYIGNTTNVFIFKMTNPRISETEISLQFKI